MDRFLPRPLDLLSIILVLGLLTGCGRREASAVQEGSASSAPLTRVRLQTDWFPQAEHGGFYQALAKGWYKEAGLDVELLPGGPGAHIKPKIINGDAEFGMNPSVDVIVAASRGLPLLMVAPFLQHDHQALLVHADSPVRDFADLRGRTLVASPSLVWIPYLKKRYNMDFALQPVPYGLAQFAADKDCVRQCIITNEPWLAARQGLHVRVLRLADAGYDGYHVLFCRPDFARAKPALVRAFVEASLRGWRDYIEGDPAPAHSLILARNKEMSAEFLAFSRGEMIRHRLVTGYKERGEGVGDFSLDRLQALADMMHSLGVADRKVPVSEVATLDFLPYAPLRR